MSVSASSDCPHCGFAMNRELDRVCPRCKRSPEEILKTPAAAPKPAAPPPIMPPRPAVAAPQPPAGVTGVRSPTPPGPGVPAHAGAAAGGAAALPHPHAKPRKQQGAGRWLLAIGGGFLLFLVLIFAAVAARQQASKPEHKAGLAIRRAMVHLEMKEWDPAIEDCREAQKLDPGCAEASLMAALAVMQISDEKTVEEQLKAMSQRAQSGATQMCDSADAWLQDCVQRAQKDLHRRTVDRTLKDYTRLSGFAYGLLSTTAVLRAAAAAETKHMDDATAWLGEAEKQVKAGEAIDPGCPLLKSNRKSLDEITAARKAAATPPAFQTPEQKLRSLQRPGP